MTKVRIVCPKCKASYSVSDKAYGRSVRCGCGHVFRLAAPTNANMQRQPQGSPKDRGADHSAIDHDAAWNPFDELRPSASVSPTPEPREDTVPERQGELGWPTDHVASEVPAEQASGKIPSTCSDHSKVARDAWDWQIPTTDEDAIRAIQTCVVVGVLSATATMVATLAGAGGMNTWNWIDVIVLLALTFGVYRRNVVCAALLFVGFVASRIAGAILHPGYATAHVGGLVLFGKFFWDGVRGTIASKRLQRGAPQASSGFTATTPQIVVLVALALASCLVVALNAGLHAPTAWLHLTWNVVFWVLTAWACCTGWGWRAFGPVAFCVAGFFAAGLYVAATTGLSASAVRWELFISLVAMLMLVLMIARRETAVTILMKWGMRLAVLSAFLSVAFIAEWHLFRLPAVQAAYNSRHSFKTVIGPTGGHYVHIPRWGEANVWLEVRELPARHRLKGARYYLANFRDGQHAAKAEAMLGGEPMQHESDPK